MVTDLTQCNPTDNWSDSRIAFTCLWLCVAGAVLVAGELSTAAPLFAAAVINVWVLRSRTYHQSRRNLSMFLFNVVVAVLVIAVSTRFPVFHFSRP